MPNTLKTAVGTAVPDVVVNNPPIESTATTTTTVRITAVIICIISARIRLLKMVLSL
jgi:hypothetical protein